MSQWLTFDSFNLGGALDLLLPAHLDRTPAGTAGVQLFRLASIAENARRAWANTAQPRDEAHAGLAGSATRKAAVCARPASATSIARTDRLPPPGRPPISPAAIRAISDVLPHCLPLLSPTERQPTGGTRFPRQVNLVDHGERRVESDPDEVRSRGNAAACGIRPAAPAGRISAHRRRATGGAATSRVCADRARSRRTRARTPDRPLPR